MKIINTDFDGIFFIENEIFYDERWYFFEDFSEKSLKNFGIDFVLKQENISLSHKNVLRGMHFQKSFSQAKILKVLSGKILDICIDIRPKSLNFWKIFTYELTPDSPQIFIAKGFAHGFLSLENNTKISYKCDDFYNKNDESGFSPLSENILKILLKYGKREDFIISAKDKNLPDFTDFLKNF